MLSAGMFAPFLALCMAGCNPFAQRSFPFEVTDVDCAFFSSEYEFYGASNAGANVEIEITQRGLALRGKRLRQLERADGAYAPDGIERRGGHGG